jgi:hypothetical protein
MEPMASPVEDIVLIAKQYISETGVSELVLPNCISKLLGIVTSVAALFWFDPARYPLLTIVPSLIEVAVILYSVSCVAVF